MYGPSTSELLAVLVILGLLFGGCGYAVARATHGLSIDVSITREKAK